MIYYTMATIRRGVKSMIFLILYYIITVVQGILAYGTTYRLTKNGGDNGVSLFGWTIVIGLASAVPGLGIYLWFRYRDD
jgi:hypothetical protein